MVTPIEARDALHHRMEALFSPDAFGNLFPDMELPKVYMGFPVNEPPFYVAVDEICETLSTSGAASMGHANLEFTLSVWLLARHKDIDKSANTLLSYAWAVFMAILADQQIDHTVDNAFPSIGSVGTAADESKRYISAANVSINCSVGSICPKEIKEIVDEANSR